MKLSPKDALKEWHHFQDSDVSETFKQYRQFIAVFSGKLPLDQIRKRAEEAAYNNADSEEKVLQYFEFNSVLTAKGLVAYIRALKAENKSYLIGETIKKYWLNLRFSKQEFIELLKVGKGFLKERDFVEKINISVLQGDSEELRAFLKYVDAKTKHFVHLRLELKKRDDRAEKVFHEIKKHFKESPYLLLDLIQHLRKKYETNEAIQYLQYVPESYEKETPEAWWAERNILGRRMMEAGNWQKAHDIISEHQLEKGEHYANAEWLLGWIELTQLNKPENAVKRFMRLYQNVGMPVSKSRMAFWTAEAFVVLEQIDQAKEYYRYATKLPGTFYGQMAIARLRALGEDVDDIDIEWHAQVSPEAKKTFEHRFIIQGLEKYGKYLSFDLQQVLLGFVAKQLSVLDEEILITEFAYKLDGPHLAVWVAKKAQYLDTVITKYGYPFLKDSLRKKLFSHLPHIVECFAHAIIRQESNFSTDAVSSANARGLMQLIDSTAKAMRRIVERYGFSRAHGNVHDVGVNITLGTTHFLQLLEKYDGYAVLALAAYNAGDRNVNEWIECFGDPRVKGDWINWMEKIPMGETRNYVQRCLENAAIYYVLFYPKERVEIINWITQPIAYVKKRA